MTRNSLFIRSLGVAATLAAVTFCSLNARAEVVFGNLGASGTDAIDDGFLSRIGSTTLGQPGNQVAFAFTSSSNPLFLELTKASLGLGSNVPYPTGVLNLVADNAGLPTGSILASATSSLGPDAKYNFNFSNYALTANTKYWLRLQDPNASTPSSFSWLQNANAAAPSALNGSGYAFDSVSRSINGGSTWNAFPDGAKLAISIEAVPEPSTIVMAGLGGLGLLVMERNRRRRKAAVAAEADDYLG
jgi:hypothetical protein